MKRKVRLLVALTLVTQQEGNSQAHCYFPRAAEGRPSCPVLSHSHLPPWKRVSWAAVWRDKATLAGVWNASLGLRLPRSRGQGGRHHPL